MSGQAALATICNNFADRDFAVPITRKHCQVTRRCPLMIFVTVLYDLFQCLTEADEKRKIFGGLSWQNSEGGNGKEV